MLGVDSIHLRTKRGQQLAIARGPEHATKKSIRTTYLERWILWKVDR